MKTSLNLSEVVEFVKRSVRLQLKASRDSQPVSIPWLSGPPGIGKSEVIRQICKEESWGLKVVYMATIMLEQITGLPKIGKDEDKGSEFIIWSRPEIFNFNKLEITPPNDKALIVLLLDDAHLCNRQVQAYMFQLLTYRCIHDHRLPENVAIILAGNRGSDKAGFQEILAPVANRIFFIDLYADVDQWIKEYALKNNIRNDIISFLQNYPDCLIGKPMESGAWPSPRSWAYASRTMDAFEDSLDKQGLFTILRGHVGTEVTAKFIEYYELYARWNAKEILNNHFSIEFKDLSKIQCYALLSSCVSYLLRVLRENKFKVNDGIDRLIDNFKHILKEMINYHKEIVPLGLKLLLLGEKTETGKITIIRRLTSDKQVINELFDIV